MKFTLRAGGEIDVLSSEEYDRGVERTAGELRAIRRQLAPSTLIVVQANATTVGAVLGGGINGQGAPLYECPPGRVARVHRLVANTGSVTPIAPDVTGWLGFYRNLPSPSNLVGFLPENAGDNTLPGLLTDGGDNAIVLREAEPLLVVGDLLPADETIVFQLQVQLHETPTERRRDRDEERS